MRLRNSAYILLTFFILSCETTEKIDDFPLRPAKLVVNCFFNADSIWEFQVSKSLSVLDNANIKLIKNATITILKDGELQSSFSSVDKDGWYRYSENLPETGREYTIQVTSPDFNNVLVAHDIVPEKTTISDVKFFIQDSIYYDEVGYGYLVGGGKFSFSDSEETQNYYEIAAYTFDSIFNYYPEKREFVSLQKRTLSISSEDLSADNTSEISNSLLFSDFLFDGKKFTMSIDFYDFGGSRKNEYYIDLKSLTREGYLYRKTIKEYYKSRNDPFSEPVMIYSNIENGFGIFSAYSQSVFKVTYDF